MPAIVLNFPAQTTCQSCGKPCSEDDLGGCFACGDTFCGKNGCAATCSCDRLAIELSDRLADLRPRLLTRLVNRVRRMAHAVRGRAA